MDWRPQEVITILEVGMTQILLIGVIKVKVRLEFERNQKTIFLNGPVFR